MRVVVYHAYAFSDNHCVKRVCIVYVMPFVVMVSTQLSHFVHILYNMQLPFRDYKVASCVRSRGSIRFVNHLF